ncbi:MAG: hypothetical protein IJS45_07595 [Clostridia bacterium]|nr:hypothetical protein [Clostridia bacterium]
MHIDKFKRDFKRIGGVFATKQLILFRDPLELYSLAENKVVAQFDSLDEALAYKIDGKTLEERVSKWTEIVFPLDFGGRGGSSGMEGFGGKWPSAGGLGKDETTEDFPARMNVKIGVIRNYDDMVRAFAQQHAAAEIEHGVVVNEFGFATKYLHGNAGSISGLTGNGREIAVHNHPAGGWPTFSKEDVVNTALGTRRGIVAVSSTAGRDASTAKYAGTYSFVKGSHFNASGFVKGVNSARLSGKDYNDAVNKWLKANQKKYGYTYSYTKAK